jgi:hypothetical protein
MVSNLWFPSHYLAYVQLHEYCLCMSVATPQATVFADRLNYISETEDILLGMSIHNARRLRWQMRWSNFVMSTANENDGLVEYLGLWKTSQANRRVIDRTFLFP